MYIALLVCEHLDAKQDVLKQSLQGLRSVAKVGVRSADNCSGAATSLIKGQQVFN